MPAGTPLRWLAVAADGQIVASLPSLTPSGALRSTMGRYETLTASLILDDTTDPGWLYGTTPGASAVVAVTGDPGSEVVPWGGIVLTRVRGGGNVVVLNLVTPESYLNRRYTGNYETTSRAQSQIAADLVTIAAGGDSRVPGSVGWPWQINVLDPGISRQQTWADSDDKTIYSALTDLSGLAGGPEWDCGWTYLHNPERIVPTFTVGSRIGAVKRPGMSTAAAFSPRQFAETTGGSGGVPSLGSSTWTEDYTEGNGANLVTATSSGQGDVRPQQPAGVAQQRPVYEYRWSPSTSITDPSVLASHAQQALIWLANGTQTVALTVTQESYAVGVDYGIGDDVDVTFDGPAFTTPITATARLAGYEIDPTSRVVTQYLTLPGGFS